MKIVFDTNVLIASLISHGSCFELLEHCARNHTLYTSDYIVNEFNEKLRNKFKYPKNLILESKNLLFRKFIKVKLRNNPNINFSDKKDIPVINTALLSKSELLITGDKKLYELEKYMNVKIIKPADFWKHEK